MNLGGFLISFDLIRQRYKKYFKIFICITIYFFFTFGRIKENNKQNAMKTKPKFRILFLETGIYFMNITQRENTWLNEILYQDYFIPKL